MFLDAAMFSDPSAEFERIWILIIGIIGLGSTVKWIETRVILLVVTNWMKLMYRL